MITFLLISEYATESINSTDDNALPIDKDTGYLSTNTTILPTDKNEGR